MNDDRISREDMEYENREWLESLDYVYENQGPDRVVSLLQRLQLNAQAKGIHLPFTANTPYINTIPLEEQPVFPGDRDMERRIKSIIRWNAMAMVVRANRKHAGLGGHISTYASSATLYEVFFNHFYRAKSYQQDGDIRRCCDGNFLRNWHIGSRGRPESILTVWCRGHAKALTELPK